MLKRMCKLSKSNSFFLFGPRGSGKSTLLKSHFGTGFKKSANKSLDSEKSRAWNSKKESSDFNKNILWIDLLDTQIEYKLNQRPELLEQMWQVNQPPWIVIDEVQKNPRLLDIVHKMLEEKTVKFALSGSSARKLKRDHANLLGGRAIASYLSPFSYFEIKDQFNLDRSLKFGLLPRFWSEQMADEDIVRSLYAYVDIYLKEEVFAEQLVRKLDPFRRFLSTAAQANGASINFSNIERDAGLGASQAQRHFEILSDTLIGFFLPPYNTSIRKRQAQRSKFYFFDTGVLRALQMLAGESLHSSTFEYGNLFETFIINDVFKMASAFEKRWRFSYLKTQAGVEVDLIVEKPRGVPILIEIKSSTDIKKEHLRALKNLGSEFPESVRYLWYRGKESLIRDEIKCIPWQEGLKELFEL